MEHRRRIKKRRPVVGLLAAVALVGITACGGDDDDGSQTADSAEADDQNGSDDGDGGDAGDSGGESDPGDGADDGGAVDAIGGGFPIPAPDGLVLDALVDSGLDLQGQRQLYYENGDRNRIVAFYDDWIDGNGEWSRTEIGNEVYYQRLDGTGISSIAITPDFDPGAQADGPVVFLLLVSNE